MTDEKQLLRDFDGASGHAALIIKRARVAELSIFGSIDL